jgi:KTSC domain
MEMRRTPVSSSAIASVGYEPEMKMLEIEFTSGSVYDYFGVPRKVYKELMAAESKGRFVSQRIRGQYPSERC